VKPNSTQGDGPREGKALLLGVGLDNQDGHVRITRGKNFHLLGGSQETHEVMQEVAIKVNEHCDRRGKPLEQITREEFREIAEKVAAPRS
jgi:hypothetical protein